MKVFLQGVTSKVLFSLNTKRVGPTRHNLPLAQDYVWRNNEDTVHKL